jgi:hypothetical protein
MNDVNDSEMKGYMELQLNDPTNHRIYSWVNEEYFYKGLERAKVEKLFVNETGRVDLYKLVQFLWGAWADGRMVALPNHECRKTVIEYISKITSCNNNEEYPDTFVGNGLEERPEPIDTTKIEAVAEMIIDANPKRKSKSRAKPKMEITKEQIDFEKSIADMDTMIPEHNEITN